MSIHRITVTFDVEADTEDEAFEQVRHELAAIAQTESPDTSLIDYVIREVA